MRTSFTSTCRHLCPSSSFVISDCDHDDSSLGHHLTMASLLRLITATLLVLAFSTRLVVAQDCFYPDGSLSTSDYACTANGGMCCPYQWACLSNGLCYNPTAQIYGTPIAAPSLHVQLTDEDVIEGRYTCTDRTWQSTGCPELCTQNNTAAGDEAITQCASGDWCCK